MCYDFEGSKLVIECHGLCLHAEESRSSLLRHELVLPGHVIRHDFALGYSKARGDG
jgi:hypothetical protein